MAFPPFRRLTCSRLPLGLVLGVLVPLRVWAEGTGLSWTQKRLEFKANSLDGSVEAVYHYENRGTEPVEITQVTTGCNCTTAAPSRTRVGAGESGDLRAVFTIDFRTGLQERPIYVYTNAGKGSPEELELVVDIRELVTLSPKLLFWRVGEAAGEKEIRLNFAEKDAVKLGAVRCLEAGYAARLRQTEAGAWVLVVSPGETKGPTQTQIQIEYEAQGRRGHLTAFAAVR